MKVVTEAVLRELFRRGELNIFSRAWSDSDTFSCQLS